MIVRGKFFPYNEKLYYKTKGYYVEISYDGTDFTAADVSPYTPVTYINCSYKNGSGDEYQPENRISAKKTLWYNSAYTISPTVTGNITVVIEDAYFRMRINTPGTYTFSYNGTVWKLGGVNVDLFDYGIQVGGTPANGNTIVVKFAYVDTFYLPETNLDITKVTVDDVQKIGEDIDLSFSPAGVAAQIDPYVWRVKVTTSGTYTFTYDYTAVPNPGWRLSGNIVDLSEYGVTVSSTYQFESGNTITVKYVRGDYWYDGAVGKMVFYTAPKAYYPEINNTVKITYDKANATAYDNVMDCVYAEVYGGTGALCIVMAGSTTQPNAYFWNGQTSVSVDASYFPMTQYQLAGDSVDPVVGFGKHQGFLIIFKKGSVGRTTLSTVEVNGRLAIDLPYVNINAKIGCDMPYSIQLIENNLVWANTSQGVHFLANTSSAYENNVVCISNKINDTTESWTKGLLKELRDTDYSLVGSHDDDKRYWLVIDSHVWLWDYNVSNYKNPSWFYFENIAGRAFIQDGVTVWHLDGLSRLSRFAKVYHDYGKAIEKVYKFAVQYFGTYDNKKNVNSVIINTISKTNSVINVRYLTDYESRDDLTPLGAVSWMLVPRDLSFRNLKGGGFAHVFRRKPHCRRVHYFTMRLENNTPLHDLAVVSAQIYYVFEGRHR